jgi:ribosomal protein S18 acetylase RimI-like enzyme
MNKINIVNYRPQHQPWFELFNRNWIEKYFEMEAVDVFVLTNPEEAILKNGGAIFMAEYDGQIAGTVALKKNNGSTYELTKMAVDENFRRRGIAEELCFACFKKAAGSGASQIVLYSQTRLKPAIALYEKLGFKPVAIEPGKYKRADTKMVIDIKDAMTSINNLSTNTQTQKICV